MDRLVNLAKNFESSEEGASLPEYALLLLLILIVTLAAFSAFGLTISAFFQTCASSI